MDNVYLAAVCAVVPGLGRTRLPKLLEIFGNAKSVFEASYDALMSSGLFTSEQVRRYIANRRETLPAEISAFCKSEEVKILSIYDDEYPVYLRLISDAPLVLYVKGEIPQADYSVGIVGSRAATEYGLRAADSFARALTFEGIPIISGGAKGVDTAAHLACLEAGGKTVAVLGTGLDIAYPYQNRGLFKRIARQGALVTEFAPGVQPLARNFPARNRIIVGLSQAVLVAEAVLKSGALITANIAADEGRDVFCVPGNIFDGHSLGCHSLIRTGAKLVDTPMDILEERQNWQRPVGKVTQQSIFDYTDAYVPKVSKYIEKDKSPKLVVAKTALGNMIIDILRGGAQSMEMLVEKSEIDFTSLSMEMLDLQVDGLVAQDQAQRYYLR